MSCPFFLHDFITVFGESENKEAPHCLIISTILLLPFCAVLSVADELS
jgi:hypothetical protein